MSGDFRKRLLVILLLAALVFPLAAAAAERGSENALDRKVQAFLEKRRGSWRDLNVPESDGRRLYELIVRNGHKRALEIGTSTGLSTIYIAWALSKTGGRVITIEIDRERHRQALENFREAGLTDYIDARLADAHRLVKELAGPFDFVFCDADKEWYKNYFVDLYPKLAVGGCYTAHNVSSRGWGGSGTAEFYRHVQTIPDLTTTLDESGAGLSISCRR